MLVLLESCLPLLSVTMRRSSRLPLSNQQISFCFCRVKRIWQHRNTSTTVRSFVSSFVSTHRTERKSAFNCNSVATALSFEQGRCSAILASATSAITSTRAEPCLTSCSTRVSINRFVSRHNVSARTFCPRRTYSTSHSAGMELSEVVKTLKNLACLALAGSWDNVGLLLEPTAPHSVCKLLLTNDLTPSVMQEAVDKSVNMIVSYHPPIFAPLKRVTQSSWKERIVAGCLERRIALYSPHTSWDAVADGVNDWLIGAFDVSEVTPVEQTQKTVDGCNKKLTIWTTQESAAKVTDLAVLHENPKIRVFTEPGQDARGGGEVTTKVSISCPASAVTMILTTLQQHSISTKVVECSDLAKVPTLGYGMGRKGHLRSPLTVTDAVTAIKSHLKLAHVRLAEAAGTEEIKTVAVCAGSGSSVLRGVEADLYLTGEMSHHEVLDAVCKGTHVVLCDHSNTERGFLKVVQTKLTEKLESKVKVVISETDRDPLLVV